MFFPRTERAVVVVEPECAFFDEADQGEGCQALRSARQREACVDLIGDVVAAVRQPVRLRDLDPVATINTNDTREPRLRGNRVEFKLPEWTLTGSYRRRYRKSKGRTLEPLLRTKPSTRGTVARQETSLEVRPRPLGCAAMRRRIRRRRPQAATAAGSRCSGDLVVRSVRSIWRVS